MGQGKGKYLYVGLDIAEKSVSNPRMLDALSFALLIKLNYTNSAVYPKSIRELKSLFHMGQDKLKRVLADAEKYGFITRDNGIVRANRVREKRGLNIRLFYSLSRMRKQTIKITDIKDDIRKSILLNHFKIVAKIRDTTRELQKSKDESAHTTKKRYDGAKSFAIRCMNPQELEPTEEVKKGESKPTIKIINGVSKRNIAKKAHCSISKAHRLVREMRRDRMVFVTANLVKVSDCNGAFYEAAANKYNCSSESHVHLRRWRGHDGLYAQCSNFYRPMKQVVFLGTRKKK